MANFYRADEFVKNTLGTAVTGAHLYWCLQPATIPSTEQQGGPTPLATAYRDSTGLSTLPQPIITDGFGHGDAYFAPGFYTLAVYNNGGLVASYPDQAIGFGVSSLNGLTGDVTIAAGSGIGVTVIGSSIIISNTQASGFPTSPQVGDILRYGVNGDSAWDSVNYAQVFSSVYAVYGSPTSPVAYGLMTGFGRAGGESTGTVNPTATHGAGMRFFLGTGSASSNTIAGWKCAQNGSNSTIPILAWYRLSLRMALDAVVGTPRYWHGLTCWNSGSIVGTNNLAVLGTTKLATDTPNSNLIGWRYSVGTDTTWKAVCITAGVSPSATVVDTGIVPDANVHLYEICQNYAGTTMYFLIDGTLVATISTNIPSAVPLAIADGLASPFVSADNKNSGTTGIGTTTYSCNITHRQ